MSDFKQAIEWLKEGKKVRRKGWGKDKNYYFIFKKKVGYNEIHSSEYGKIQPFVENFEATDWEIYCKDHEWINYEDVISLEENIAEFYDKNPQFGWRGCPHPESYTKDKFCRNCGIRKPTCKEHDWICYEDGEDCQYVSCSKEHKKICENCGIEKPKEIKFEKRSFSERIAYLKAKFDIGELTEEMYKIQIVAAVEDLK